MAEAETPKGAIARAARMLGSIAGTRGDVPLADVARATGRSAATDHGLLGDPIDAASAAAWCPA